MAKVRQRKFSIDGLTSVQYGIICDIVHAVKDIMVWDDSMQEYTDHDNFVYSLSKEEYQELLEIRL